MCLSPESLFSPKYPSYQENLHLLKTWLLMASGLGNKRSEYLSCATANVLLKLCAPVDLKVLPSHWVGTILAISISLPEPKLCNWSLSKKELSGPWLRMHCSIQSLTVGSLAEADFLNLSKSVLDTPGQFPFYFICTTGVIGDSPPI